MHWPARLREFAELDSTNEEGRRLALAGETGPLWLRAARQSAGRGRRGREWQSSEGNLFATLLLQPARPKAEWAQLSFVTAIAVADMAAHFAAAAAIAVKWPNDVLADDRKLAGILLETADEALAIGIGINLKNHPAGTEFPAVSIAALGVTPPSAATALALLAPTFARWYDLWDSTGFGPIRDAWLARAAGLGQRIRARLPGSERAGLFEGIDEEGALLLNEGTRTRAVTAGEVFFG
jgi:BirA family transcriptional regulator, biotin operon repressor / biotin---[acetyl-CoA-carboxylase] ligase